MIDIHIPAQIVLVLASLFGLSRVARRRPRVPAADIMLIVLLTMIFIALLVILTETGDARASCGEAGAPLQITHFSMEATRATTTKGSEPFVNEPYVPAFTQAGGHPWALTSTIEFANEKGCGTEGHVPTKEPKDVVVDLPPGLLGNPLAVPRCSLTAAFALGVCPIATQVGVYRVRWFDGKQKLGPIVSVVPEKGQSAEFVLLNSFHISAGLTGHLIRVHEHGREAYGLSVTSSGIPTVQLYRVETTFWGVPADPSHDPMRDLVCGTPTEGGELGCGEGGSTGGKPSGVPPVPFLTLPTDCAAGPETATVRADSWEEPGSVNRQTGEYAGWTEKTATMPAVTGCNLLAFDPSLEVQPGHAAGRRTGRASV